MHFNIGVTAYRLGNYPRAATAFAEAARTPQMAALAYYNLGLVAVAQQDPAAARRWFALAQQRAEDERLRLLAARQLDELPPPPAHNWVGFAALGAGYDDNVGLVSDSSLLQVSGSDDAYSELQLAWGAPLTRPWRLDASAVLTDYQSLDRFDQLNLQGGARYRLDLGIGHGDIGLQFAYASLDGEGFESRRAAFLQTQANLNEHWQLRTRYRFSGVDGLGGFTALSGARREGELCAAWRGTLWALEVEYRYDRNSYEDDALSVQRHQIGLDLEHSLPRGWSLTLGASKRHSDYDLNTSGTEDRLELAFGVSKALSEQLRFVLRYAHGENDADLPELNYERNRVYAAIEALL